MQHHESFFAGAGDRQIYHQGWHPQSPPRALLLLAHGAGEHSGRYEEFARYFCDRGIAVEALDHHGHGHSEGRYGYTDDFGDYLLDLHQLRETLANRHPDLPLFLLGHSMGGLIAGSYLLDQQAGLAGAILCSSLVRVPDEPGALLRAAVRVLAVVLPRLGVNKIDPSGVCRDPAVVNAYKQDPLVFHGAMSARMLRELFAAMDVLKARAAELSLPLLMLHGEADSLTAASGSQLLHERATSIDKTLTVYPDWYHELFNEPERQAIMETVVQWCEAHLPSA